MCQFWYHTIHESSFLYYKVTLFLQPSQRVLVLLDAAKACQTHPPDLTRHACHFVVLSFYKIFGYPTGMGALLVRSDVLDLLQPPFLGGGSVMHVLPRTWPLHAAPRSAPACFEAGTPHYQGIAAISSGFAAWRRQAVDRGGAIRACDMARCLAETLRSLTHSNARPLCSVVSFQSHRSLPKATPETLNVQDPFRMQGSELNYVTQMYTGKLGIGDSPESHQHSSQSNEVYPATGMPAHGPVVAFVVWDMHGQPVSSYAVRDLLAEQHIYVRAGCCCNPGACGTVLGLTDADMLHNVEEGWSCRGDVGVVRGRHTGIVRASLGIMSDQEDVDALVHVLVSCFADQGALVDVPDGKKDLPEANTVQQKSDVHTFTGSTCPHDRELCAPKNLIRDDGRPGVDSIRPSSRLQAADADEQTTVCAVSCIYVYPVKSLAGFSAASWPVTTSGLLFDRAWAVMDRTGCILSCARFPKLQLLRVSVYLKQRMLCLSWQGPNVEGSASSQHASLLGVEWPPCMQSCFHNAGAWPENVWASAECEGGITQVGLQSANQWISEHVGIECFLAHRCRYIGKTIGNAECMSSSEVQHTSQEESSHVMGIVSVGAKCTCWPRTEVAGPVASATPGAPSNSTSIESKENFLSTASAEKQQSSQDAGLDAVHATSMTMSSGFSNQAPMLLASLGSVCMAACLLRNERRPRTTVGSKDALPTGSTQHAHCPAGSSDCDVVRAVDVAQSGGQSTVLSDHLLNEMVQRFRANLILSGERPHSEADWRSVCIDMGPYNHTSMKGISSPAQASFMPRLRLAVGEQAVRCRAINVVAATGTADDSNGGLYKSLRRACAPGKVVWGVYVWPQHDAV